MLFDLLAGMGSDRNRAMSSVPYTGTGAARLLNVGVQTPALAIIKQLDASGGTRFYDTVRGDSKRIRMNEANEDTFAAFTFNGAARIYSGASENLGQYDSYHLHVLSQFMDIVLFTGGSGSVAHALGETPAFALVLRRLGSGVHTVMGVMGSNERVEGTSLGTTRVAQEMFTAVDGSAFDPTGKGWVTAGANYVAYLFGTGRDRVAVGTYTGQGASQIVTLPLVPRIVLLWGYTANIAGSPAGFLTGLISATAGALPWYGPPDFVFVDTHLEGNQLVLGSTADVAPWVYQYVAIG